MLTLEYTHGFPTQISATLVQPFSQRAKAPIYIYTIVVHRIWTIPRIAMRLETYF